MTGGPKVAAREGKGRSWTRLADARGRSVSQRREGEARAAGPSGRKWAGARTAGPFRPKQRDGEVFSFFFFSFILNPFSNPF